MIETTEHFKRMVRVDASTRIARWQPTGFWTDSINLWSHSKIKGDGIEWTKPSISWSSPISEGFDSVEAVRHFGFALEDAMRIMGEWEEMP